MWRVWKVWYFKWLSFAIQWLFLTTSLILYGEDFLIFWHIYCSNLTFHGDINTYLRIKWNTQLYWKLHSLAHYVLHVVIHENTVHTFRTISPVGRRPILYGMKAFAGLQSLQNPLGVWSLLSQSIKKWYWSFTLFRMHFYRFSQMLGLGVWCTCTSLLRTCEYLFAMLSLQYSVSDF